jgi:hypothetical protein
LNSELPFAVLLTLSLAAFNERDINWWLRSLVGALLLTGAIYMRPIALPLIIIIPLSQWPRHRSIKRALCGTFLSCLVAVTMITPWALRNEDVFGVPVPISANFGVNLWMGNNPSSSGGYMPLPDGHYGSEVERDAYFKEVALTFIAEQPVRYALLSLKRFQLSFDRETIGVAWNEQGILPWLHTPLKAASTLYWYLLAILALVGVTEWVRAKPARLFDPLILSAALFSAIAVLVVGMDRYHLPLAPMVALFAAVGTQSIYRKFTNSRLRRANG